MLNLFKYGVSLLLYTIAGSTGIIAFGQPSGYTIQSNLNSENGLQQNTIFSLVQDPCGNLLLQNGTRLFKFNGKQVSFLGDAVSGIGSIPYSRLGLLNESKTVAINPAFAFGYISCTNEKVRPVAADSALVFGQGSSCRVLVVKPSFLAQIYTTALGEVRLQQMGPLEKEQFMARSLFVIDSLHAFLVYSNLLLVINAEEQSIQAVNLEREPQKCMLAGRKMILITATKETFFYDEQGKRVTNTDPFNTAVEKLVHKTTGELKSYQDIKHDFLLAGDTLYMADAANKMEPLQVCLQLPARTIVSAITLSTDENCLFLGTISQGLFIAYRNQFSLYRFPGMGGTIDNIIYSHTRLKNGDILTRYGTIKAEQNGYTTRVSNNREHGRYFRDFNGKVYKGVWNVMEIWDETGTNRIKQLRLKNEIFGFCNGPSNSLFFVTNNTIGTLRNDSVSWEYPLGHQYGNITSIGYAGDYLWLVADSGLVRLNANSPEKSDRLVLPLRNIRQIYPDQAGNVWIGTRGQGIYRLTPTAQLVELPLDKQGALQFAHSFYEDKNGFFWIPTNNGIIQVLKKDLESYSPGLWVYYYHYSGKTGLPVNEFNAEGDPYNTVSGSGAVSFPSMSGVLEFNPGFTRPFLPGSKIQVSKIESDGHVFSSGKISLHNNFKTLVINATVPYYGAAENLQVYYNLEGVSDNWSEMNTMEPLVINRLPFGNYKLRIRKINGFGIGNWDEQVISIIVMAPWYLKWWSLLLFFICFLSTTWFIVKWRLKRVKERAQIEKLVVENELKAIRAQINPHFLQNTIDFMARQIRAGDTEKAVNIVKRVSVYFRQVLNMSEKTSISLEDEIESMEEYLRMQQLLHPQLFEYTVNIDDNVDTFGIEVPAMLLQPLVENCLKHGFAKMDSGGKIDINVAATDQFLQISIKDNGQGLTETTMQQRKRSMGINLTKKRISLMFKKKTADHDITAELIPRTDNLPGAEFLIFFKLRN